MEWFDHFEKAEMAEFNSATYFPIDLKGMTALFALAPDAEIRKRAGAAIVRPGQHGRAFRASRRHHRRAGAQLRAFALRGRHA